jgi:hypothetical protein
MTRSRLFPPGMLRGDPGPFANTQINQLTCADCSPFGGEGKLRLMGANAQGNFGREFESHSGA